MIRVLCLDPSLTATGLAWTDPAAGPPRVLKPPRGVLGSFRLQWFAATLAPLIRTAAVLVVENYAFSRSNRAHQLGELGGVIRLTARHAKIPTVVVNPGYVKMAATGKGNASKNAVLLAAAKRLGYDGEDNDIADAMWLAELARHAYGIEGRVDLPKTHLRGVAKVEWPAPLVSRAQRPGRGGMPHPRTFPALTYRCPECEDPTDAGDLHWVSTTCERERWVEEGWVCGACIGRVCPDLDLDGCWDLREVVMARGAV